MDCGEEGDRAEGEEEDEARMGGGLVWREREGEEVGREGGRERGYP